jgi:hypothetical protein
MEMEDCLGKPVQSCFNGAVAFIDPVMGKVVGHYLSPFGGEPSSAGRANTFAF